MSFFYYQFFSCRTKDIKLLTKLKKIFTSKTEFLKNKKKNYGSNEYNYMWFSFLNMWNFNFILFQLDKFHENIEYT